MSDFGDELGGRVMGSAEGVAQRLLTGAFRKVSRASFEALVGAVRLVASMGQASGQDAEGQQGARDEAEAGQAAATEAPRQAGGRTRATRAARRPDEDEDYVVAMSYADRAAAEEAVEVLAQQGVDAVIGAEGPDGTCAVVAEVSPRAAAALGARVAKADAAAHKGEFEADMARARGLHNAAAASQSQAASEQQGPVLKARGA